MNLNKRIILCEKNLSILKEYSDFDISLICGDNSIIELLLIKTNSLIKQYQDKYQDLIFEKIKTEGIYSISDTQIKFLDDYTNKL